MASNAKLLRNIITSGGLFTENILLKLRDRPTSKKIGQITSFYSPKEIEKICEKKLPPHTLDTLAKKQKREFFKSLKAEIFEWGQRKWEETFPNLELHKFKESDIETKWLLPLFELIGYELQEFTRYADEEIDEELFGDFTIKYQPRIPCVNVFFHFVSPYDDLDQKIKSNPKHLSHHELCQQFVNYHPEVKWLILSNGTELRLLSTYYYSYSKGYVEFNLKDIFGGDLQEFEVLFNMLHPSRFVEVNEEQPLLIEEFQAESQEEGVKVGDNLRDNVNKAIETLGNQLIQQNGELYKRVKHEDIDLQEFYAELLRIIYRIIFILYAEQRNMLPGSGTLYFKNFSLSSFRMLAEKPIKNDSQSDLWQKLFVTFQLVRDGNKYMEVPCFNGSLFDNANLSILFPDGVEEGLQYSVSNDVLLGIMRLLTTAQMGHIRQRINFIEVSEEEIGAIYESLLDYFPIFNKKDQFELRYQTSERKGTGSYYTPKSLIDFMINKSLRPLINDLKKKHNESKDSMIHSILNLKICDPSCGGGTFLLSTMDYLGEVLSKIENDSRNPTEYELRNARRKILQHCLYGVDKNPLAVELCKISLWLRACVKDKPLNFLDNHIKCGNSLIGLVRNKDNLIIHDKNYKALKGNKKTGISPENRKLWTDIRKQIRDEVKTIKKSKNKIVQLTKYIEKEKNIKIDTLKYEKVLNLPENSLSDIKKKRDEYYKLKKESNISILHAISNAFCSSFFWPLNKQNISIVDFDFPNNTFISEIKNSIINPNDVNVQILKKILKLSKRNRFFHWYLEFPEVFNKKKNGFDCILTNPPWEKLEFNDNEFFAEFVPNINDLEKSERNRVIKKTLENKRIFHDYSIYFNNYRKKLNYFTRNYEYQLSNKLNYWKLFLERNLNLLNDKSYFGIITPAGILSEKNSNHLRYHIYKKFNFSHITQFFSSEDFFPNIGTGQPLCLLSINKNKERNFQIKAGVHTNNQLLHEIEDFDVKKEFMLKISPKYKNSIKKGIESLAIPIVESNNEIKLLNHIVDHPKFSDNYDVKRELNRTEDEENGIIGEKKTKIPVLEGKHLVHFGYTTNDVRFFVQNTKKYIEYKPDYQFKRIVLRAISNISLRRRMFVSIINKNIATVNSLNYVVPYILNGKNKEHISNKMLYFLTGIMGSLVSEFYIRHFSSNNNINQYLIYNLPIPEFDGKNVFHSHLVKIIPKFQMKFNKWADRMVKCSNYIEKRELETEYYEELAEIDATVILIFDLKENEIKTLFKYFDQINKKLFTQIKQKINVLKEKDKRSSQNE